VKTQGVVSGGFCAHPKRWQQDSGRHPSHRLHPPACGCFSLVVFKAAGTAVTTQPDSGLDREDPVISCVTARKR